MDPIELLAERVSAVFSGQAQPAAAGPRRVSLKAEARPGRSAALVVTEGGESSEIVLPETVCRQLAAVLDAAARGTR